MVESLVDNIETLFDKMLQLEAEYEAGVRENKSQSTLLNITIEMGLLTQRIKELELQLYVQFKERKRLIL